MHRTLAAVLLLSGCAAMYPDGAIAPPVPTMTTVDLDGETPNVEYVMAMAFRDDPAVTLRGTSVADIVDLRYSGGQGDLVDCRPTASPGWFRWQDDEILLNVRTAARLGSQRAELHSTYVVSRRVEGRIDTALADEDGRVQFSDGFICHVTGAWEEQIAEAVQGRTS